MLDVLPVRSVLSAVAAVMFVVSSVAAQDSTAATSGNGPMMQHEGMQMGESGWMFMQDGIAVAEYDHQGGPRGGDQFVVPNWWMGMASREVRHGRFTLNAMFSLDPATVGSAGYREIFQAGEARQGKPLIDRQHPHDLFMQLAAVWRLPINDSTGFTIAGGPAGEPALGPVAFMHRASAADNPTAPLGHHTFDSTHIAYGVVTAAVDHGRWIVETSAFNGREPDEHRWDVDFGKLDSFSGRVWFRPTDALEFQVSSGRLKSPEELEPGHDVVRSTVSGSWTQADGDDIAAVTAAFGINDTDHGTRHAMFVEGTRRRGLNSLYGRLEAVQAETALLLTGLAVESPLADIKDTVVAGTVGAVRDVTSWHGVKAGIGADLTLYGVPAALRSAYGSHPLSVHLFFRIRPPAGSMGRMWNMRMSQPMLGHSMSMPMHHSMP